jgi:PAS domain S-box-containing protein
LVREAGAAGEASFLAGGAEMGARIRAHDWRAAPIGSPHTWPQPLKTLVAVMLGSTQPMFMAWGDQRTLLYNDAYGEILGNKHPAALGRDFLEVWDEIRGDLAPIVDEAYAGRPVQMDDIELLMHRKGFPEETHFAFSYTPVQDEAGEVAGFFCPCMEITDKVIAQRGQAFRIALDERLHATADASLLIAIASEALGRYLKVGQVSYGEVDQGGETARVDREWNSGSMAPNARVHRMADYGPAFAAALNAGETIAIADVRLDPRTSSSSALAAFDRAMIAGFINVPVVKAGRLAAILAVHSPTPRAWSTGEVSLAQDIAERVWAAAERARAEADLRESDARLRSALQAAELSAAEIRAVLESMPDAVYIGTADGITLANQSALDQLGFSSRDDLNRHVAMLAEEIQTREVETGAFIPVEKQAFMRAFGGERVVQDVRVRHRLTGEDRIVRCAAAPVMIGGQVIAAVAVNTDITEARRGEAALVESEARLRTLTDNLPSGMVYQLATGVAGAERRFLYVSQSHEKLTGVPAEAVLADPTIPYSLILPEHRQALADAEMEAIRSRLPLDVQARFRRTDGEVRWCRILSGPRGQSDGSLIWDGLQIDITEQKQLEASLRELNETLEQRVAQRTAELETAQEALRQSQKLEAMGQLTGGVAHDFNNLLTPIIGSLDMLLRRGIGSERERRLMDGALQSAERAKTLVQRLLAFARRQPLQPSSVDLRRLVREMAELIASTSGPTVEVRLDLPEDLAPVLADANQLEMAILNLAVNGRDAMPDGGVLTLSAHGEEVASGEGSALRPGSYVRLSVTDTGVGMDAATAARAVEPFFSTKGIGKGTGLGLSMVHGLALQLNGALAITSRPMEGARIDLWLPISSALAEAAPEGQEPVANSRAAGTALLVDDEDLVRMSTADMLMDLGYEVVEAGSAEEALQLIAEGLAPDLLVTDHLMPGMTGADLARRLRARWAGLPVLIISGYAEAEGVEPSFTRLTKPFRVGELAERLAAIGPASA